MDKSKASTLEREDHLALQVVDERLERLRREAELMLERSGIAAQIRAAETAKQIVVDAISSAYELTAFDHLNIDDGSIKRAVASSAT